MASRITKSLSALLLGAGLLLQCAWAQTDSIGMKKLTPQEEQRLRAILAEPVPKGVSQDALRKHFVDKSIASTALSDDGMREAYLKEAVHLLPDPLLKFSLARIFLNRGDYAEGDMLMQQALAGETRPHFAVLMQSYGGCDLYRQNKNDAAMASISAVEQRIQALIPTERSAIGQLNLARAASKNASCLSRLHQRFGRYAKAAEASEAADLALRKGLPFLQDLKQDRSSTLVTQTEVAYMIAEKAQSYRMAGRLHDSEIALAELLRYAQEVQLNKIQMATIYTVSGNLRFSQREFQQAEHMLRAADSALQSIGHEPLALMRTGLTQNILMTLAGQRRWADAVRELDQVDRLAGHDSRLQARVRFALERGIVYLGAGRHVQAAPLFAEAFRRNQRFLGEHHIATGQASGLEGTALWRTQLSEHKVKAITLLKAAVQAYMSPANADFLENIGLRKELREIIFAAYLEAVSSTPGEDAVQALGAADWVRGGLVQEALGDAAARAAASTPALADVVRREQDAKNEVAGLRRYLSGEVGATNSPLPAITAQMRERIAVLEAERAKLQAEIKARFPEYDRLVRPTQPSVQDITRQLEPQQALLMLLPTTDAVYAWAVASDRPASFVRVPLPEIQLNGLVAGLRRDLDFANGAAVGRAYDSASAFALYDKLLAPLAATWQGKTQLVIAAGGSLSQLPFSVLHTKAGGGMDASAPWLIKEASITQVPSLSAWLAIKSLAKAKSAPQAFAGWGDPAFGPQALAASTTPSTQARSITLTRASTLADLDHPEKTTTAPSALQYAKIPALPDTRDELLAIAGTLNADPARDLFLGPRATRDSVLAASKSGELANKRVIAFATHGLMAGDLPNLTQPALAMAATGTEDKNPFAPLLTLEDVLTLKLNADWVVLSACNTAAADGKAEEALSGLARGFFYAGSRSLLVTHWAVESESARELTTSTFAHYAANPTAPKAESLRQAMLKVMAMPQYGHPAYWAPYALVGDGGR